MRTTLTLLLFLCLQQSVSAQTITVGGLCIPSPITLNKVADMNGKSAYEGTGTVNGTAGTNVKIYWLTPGDLWILACNTVPYFIANCQIPEPSPTGNIFCIWQEVTPGSCTGTSALSISSVTPLPIKLKTFGATRRNDQIELKWVTSSEQNNAGFEVQRSTDASYWQPIGFVKGAGNSSMEKNYRFTDATTPAKKLYYRLEQSDWDGNKKMSPVVAVDISKSNLYSIANNPGNGVFKIKLNSGARLAVLDLSGRLMQNKTAGTNTTELDLSAYPSGTYLLQLKFEGEVYTEKLIKQ